MRLATWRSFHKTMGLIIGLQLLIWTASGLFFALNPIEDVRGDSDSAEQAPLREGLEAVSPSIPISALLERVPKAEVMSVRLRPHLDDAVFELQYRADGETRWATAEASTGQLRGPIDSEEALAIARHDFVPNADVLAVELIDESGRGSEYRGRPLPAYRVSFDHPHGTRIYVSVDRASVTARRNDRWRLFDLLWALHIMDYRDRDDFNTLWLQVASVLGVAAVTTGFALAILTSWRARKSHRRSAVTSPGPRPPERC